MNKSKILKVIVLNHMRTFGLSWNCNAEFKLWQKKRKKWRQHTLQCSADNVTVTMILRSDVRKHRTWQISGNCERVWPMARSFLMTLLYQVRNTSRTPDDSEPHGSIQPKVGAVLMTLRSQVPKTARANQMPGIVCVQKSIVMYHWLAFANNWPTVGNAIAIEVADDAHMMSRSWSLSQSHSLSLCDPTF